MNTQDKTQDEEKQTTAGDNEKEITKSLAKVGKGASLLFIGTMLGMVFGFLMRIVIARFYSVEDYGIFSLYYSFLLIFGSVGALGLRDGLNRYIGYYTGKKEEEKIDPTIKWGITFGAISGIILGVVLILTSGYIAPILSEDPNFVFYLRIVGLTTPFLVIFYVILSVFRGFERAKETIIFSSIGKQLLILIGVSTVGLMAFPFEIMILAVSVAVIIITIVLYIYYQKRIKKFVTKSSDFFSNSQIGKNLLLFSLPLLLVSIMAKVMAYTDTMMLAYFQTEIEVGLYNAAKPISLFIKTGLTVSIFIYQPLVARLYAQKRYEENDVIYTSLTKWVLFITTPIAICFILYPKVVLSVFGADYSMAASALQVLSIMYLFRNLAGPFHSTLIGYGKSKFVMYINFSSAFLNVLFNLILIPIYGILGAAIATAATIISATIIKSIQVYKISGIHVLKIEIIKPFVFTSLIVLAVWLFIREVIHINLLSLGILFISIYLIYFGMIILTKSLSKYDIKLLMMLEKKSGLNLKMIKNVLRRYM